VPASGCTERLDLNMRRLHSECVTSKTAGPGTADPPGVAQRIGSGIGLAVSVPPGAFDSVVDCGYLFSQFELVRLRIREAPDLSEPTPELLLDTANDVFTYAGPCRYANGVPQSRVGLLFSCEIESDRADEATATPFDSGAVFQHLRPSDPRSDQIAFVRRHELPVPAYRELLERYLAACFADPVDYIRGVDPLNWFIPVQGGDARRWTFEVRFRASLSINHRVLAVFLPRAMAAYGTVMTQITRWRAQGVDVRPPYGGADHPESGHLEALTTEYWLRYLGI
jgi:hypothetical protein